MTEEELRRLADATRELTDFTRFQSEAAAAASAETKRLAQEEKGASEAASRFKSKMDAATGATGAVVDAFVTYNKEVYKGASANQAAAASIEKMAEAAKYAGAFLAILVPGGPVVKALVAGLGLLTGKLLEAGAEVARHTDQVFKAYQDMAKIGATGAGGMQDVFDGLQKVGLGTEKFGEYLKLVNENSKDLALFGGSVLKGRKAFEDTMGSLTREQRVQLELMGLDRTAQSEATMGYIKQQRLLTMGTKTQMDTSSTAVMKYIKETDELTRITGMNRQEQQKALDEAMSREQFAASIAKIQREQGKEAAEAAKNTHAMLYAIDPKAGRQFADSLSGFIGSSEDAQQAYMATGGKITEVSNRFMSGQIKSQKDAVAAAQELAVAYGQTAEQFEGQALMGNLSSTVGSVQMLYKMQQAASNDLNANYEQAVKDAEKRDKTTTTMAQAENATRETQLMLQGELNKLMPAYVEKTAAAAEANRKLVEATGKLAEDVMDKLSPAFEKLFEALGPMVTKMGELMKDHVLPALVRAIESLAKFITKFSGGVLDVMNADGTDAKVKASGKAELGETVGEIGGAYAGMKGGAALGTGIGTALMPGVGTAVGAVGGGLVGALLGYLGGGALGRGADAAAQDKSGMQQLAAMFGRKNETEVPMSERDKAWLAQQKEGIPVQPKAAGGPVSAKTPYLVGEEGPELFVPSLAGDIVPTGQLQGTTGSALKQSDAIEKIVDQIVLDIKTRQKISDIDADRAKNHSDEQKTQTEKINKSINDIVVSSKELDSISKIDLKRAQDYSIFYKGFIETKTKFEKDQLEAINYQLTEGTGGGGGGSGGGLKLPSMPGISGMGGGQGLQTTKQDDLSKMGLNIKAGDVQAEGAGISPRLIELARQIQGGVPGFNYFSAFNDKFHQEKAPGSQHAKGLALDFTVAQPPSLEEGKAITDWLKGLGASLAIDEYNNPSSKSTAGHFHAQIPGFEEGGMLGAGKVGIAGEGGKPELISGPASITPMNDLMGALNNLNAVMERSHSTLSEIARISKATSDSSAKMLSYAQN
jgi:hypothetical protein